MEFNIEDWTCDRIKALSGSQQLALARRFSGTLLQTRVLLGRCLLTIDRSGAYAECGCNSALHYALLELGIPEREVRETMRVARRLEDLPLLTQAVEQNSIGWSALLAVLPRATPDNEERWLRLAQTCTMRILERLLDQDARGNPATPDEIGPEWVKLQVVLPIEVMELMQWAMRDLGTELGRRMSLADALECFAFERLSGSAFPDEKTAHKLREEVRRDIAARRASQSIGEEEEQPACEAEDNEAPAAPWGAVAAQESQCPGAAELQLVARAPVPHWQNTRLDFNEEARLATPAQRREILRRDGYACAVPGCPNILWLQVHHVVFYCRGGATLPGNLVAVCSRCHRHIHMGLLKVSGEAPHGLKWSDRRGRELGTGVADVGLDEPVGFAEELLAWLSLMAPD